MYFTGKSNLVRGHFERELRAARSQSCLNFLLISLFLVILGAFVLGTPTHSVAFGAAVGAIVGCLLALINTAVVGRRVRAMRRDINRLVL
jgi:predicted branched-subunit amino acid permease